MATIIQTADKTFSTDNGRGTTMVLSWNETCGYWQVMSDNAAVRAYRSLGVKIFNSLDQVENHYKVFRGIQKLMAA